MEYFNSKLIDKQFICFENPEENIIKRKEKNYVRSIVQTFFIIFWKMYIYKYTS